MPRVGDPLFVPNTGKNAKTTVDLDKVPDEVKAEVEEIYKYLKKNPNGRMRVEFTSKQELETYIVQVRSYCEQRPVTEATPEGPLYFRRSPARGLKDTQMDFRVTDVKPDDAASASETPATGQEWRSQDKQPTPAATGRQSRKNAG